MVKRGVRGVRGVRREQSESRKEHLLHKHPHHPLFRQKWSFGQRTADAISGFGGSWHFILLLFAFLLSWIGLNSWLLITRPYDPYPYILLNLVLSTLAATQAPVILMAQNRQAERDRVQARYDYQINRKAEREIQDIKRELRQIREIVGRR